jgi:hypothetical protein
MIAPALERAPRMLLVIGEDEQGLPTETIILEPSVSELYAALRAWLQGVLPKWLGRALGLTRESHALPLAACEPGLIDARLRWAGL